MKYMIIFSIFIGSVLLTSAQSSVGGNTTRQTGKANTQAKKSAAQLRGSGQYHGSKDTTPGSPMGTGGAGGNEMAGSPAGSASETAVQSGKANAQSTDQAGGQGSDTTKANTKKKTVVRRNRRM